MKKAVNLFNLFFNLAFGKQACRGNVGSNVAQQFVSGSGEAGGSVAVQGALNESRPEGGCLVCVCVCE